MNRESNERLRAASLAYKTGDLNLAFGLMEEAHVLGQRHFLTHWRAHAWMLRVGIARRDGREIAGQLFRLFLTPFAHLIGWLPIGNTGGANVSGFTRMPVPEHLQSILNHRTNNVQNQVPLSAPLTVPSSRFSTGVSWWSLALAIASADLVIKYAVHTGLPYGASIPLTEFFNLVHRWNTGAAFSFLADAGGWQRYFFSILALVVSAVLVWMLSKPLPKIEALGYSLILGGALGNAADRIARGYVVDFLDFHWHDWHWPAFNLADIGICIGATLLIAASIRTKPNQAPAQAQ